MAEEMTTVLPIVGFAAAAHPSGVGMLIIKHLPGIAPVGATPEQRGGPGCLNSFSASMSGASAGVRLPSGEAAG